jgi:hypothetical protein
LSLCGKELGLGAGIGVVRGDLDESIDIIFGDGLSNPLGALDVNVGIREVPRVISQGWVQ